MLYRALAANARGLRQPFRWCDNALRWRPDSRRTKSFWPSNRVRDRDRQSARFKSTALWCDLRTDKTRCSLTFS